MRPISNGPENTRTFELIIIVVLIIGILIGVLWIYYSPTDEETESSFFMNLNLKNHEIETGKNTLLEVKIHNPTERTYSDLSIQLASSYPEVELAYTEEYSMKKVEGEYVLTVPLGRPLRTEGETTTYTFDVGGKLYPGTSSTTLEISARVISTENILDDKNLDLTIVDE